MTQRTTVACGALVLTALAAVPGTAPGQDRIKAMPGYDQFMKMRPLYQNAFKSGSVFSAAARAPGSATGSSRGITWAADGKGFDYLRDGTRYHFDLASRKTTPAAGTAEAAAPVLPPGLRRGGSQPIKGCGGALLPAPVRGRQRPVAASPDGKLLASYRDRNLSICNADGSGATPVTTDGNDRQRIKYGTATWVYGEELDQTTAMWWNPAGTRLAYFRFDESQVPDFYLAVDQTRLQTRVDVEAYPKAGVPNPVVDLFVYDPARKQSTRIDVRGGKPFSNDVVGHYVYDVTWSPGGRELLIHRTNRRQNILELAACSPETGQCRAIIREEWPTGWVENHPPIRYLADSTRFLWESERNGFKNYYLYDLGGRLLATVTSHQFEVAGIVRVDEKTGTLWYLARDGDNFMKLQLHKVGLNGRGERRLTDPAFTHQVEISPDGRYFIDVAQTHVQPPVSRVVEVASGKIVAELARSDLSVMEQRGLRKAEVYPYLAADGKTRLYGELWLPSNFDPAKRYPVLTSVYGGPAAGTAVSENFSAGNPQTEYGFVIVALSSRAMPGMGKRTLDDIYLKLGQTEMDDMAEGVKALWNRPYIDKDRVGIYGTSYGGYTALMEILRYPDVFSVASASSPVTDWRHYDTIYTERYMWLPDSTENKVGYDKGSAMSYARNLTGRLLLDYGTADDNVHPNNMMQIIKALQAAGKSFELQLQPDIGHSGVNQQRMMEFFLENLIQYPERIRAGYEQKAVP